MRKMSIFNKFQKHPWFGLAAALFTFMLVWSPGTSQETKASLELENLTWMDAEDALKRYKGVLIALGARTKEHGPHLPLNRDYIMAEYLKDRVKKEVAVAVLPTIQYGYYPSFLEYPGSISIQ